MLTPAAKRGLEASTHHLIDNLKQELVCQVPGANPRFVPLATTCYFD